MRILIFAALIACITGCGVNKSSFNPHRKYSPQQLDKDFTIFQNILEESHPGLYWYTSKDSMDYYFAWGREQIRDSMTEVQFRKLVSYILSKMNCGHTTARPSKKYYQYLDTIKNEKFFPLLLKVWDDTAVVSTNPNRRDSLLKRGTIIKGIDGRSMEKILDTMFNYISSDGYNLTHKYQQLSNRGGFGSLYTNLFGLSRQYKIDYLDSLGAARSAIIPWYDPARDTTNRAAARQFKRPTRKERKRMSDASARSMRIDTASSIAYLDVNSFAKGYGLKKFFKQAFDRLDKDGIKYLVIDVRGNGGGSVTNSTLLTKFIASDKFKIGDSLYALNRESGYRHYINKYFLNRLFMVIFTRKKRDGYYHFRYFENHYFKPRKKDHFDGKVYVLIGGNSFSATTLFTHAIMNQENVVVVGEETGGGAYGNTAWLIPDVKLPETEIEFRLPMFRLVIDKNIPKNGRGILPEVESKPTVNAIKNNEDFKMNKVMELIQEDKKKNK